MISSDFIVSEKKMDLFEKVKVGNNQEVVFIPFSETIATIRETEAKISYWHGKVKLFDGPNYNDSYGYMTSYENALKEAIEYQKKYTVDTESTLEIKIHLSITEQHLVKNKIMSGSTNYLDIPEERVWLTNVKDIEQLKDNYNQLFLEKKYEEAYDLIKNYVLVPTVLVNNLEVWNTKGGELESLNNIKSQYSISTKKFKVN